MTRSRLISALLLLTLLVACNSGRPPKIGETAPDFTVTDGSRSITLSQLRGKPVLLNFWASWCAPCVAEMPDLVELQKMLGDKATIFAVSVDSDPKAYEQFIKEHHVDLLTIRDPKQQANALYGTFAYPETYVIDRNGKIVRKFIGQANWTSPEIVEYINKL